MGGGNGGGGNDYKDAKDFLDKIGQQVHAQMKSEATNYVSELKGHLSLAKVSGVETAGFSEPCELINDKRENLIDARGDPCKELSGKVEPRFSDTLGGQCTDSKMRSGGKGACAPYRRLHLCNKNMEKMEKTSTAKHDLLLDVCLAAKHEGQSISGQHGNYHKDSTGSTICTVLARSFADIGDIIRGKDLFYGNTQESAQRKKLDDKLKEIFKEIHDEVTKGSNGQALKTRYNGDTENFFKLREDWWELNRQTVWKALTCHAPQNAQYFRQTCGGNEKTATLARDKCRCKHENRKDDTDQVPTYFDYVPQFLRWFEEWAEDFCRKKNKKIKDVKQQCRDYEQKLYCSGNGYDCTKTIYKKGKLVIGSECTNCSVWCRLYETWIDNQKKEFLKQKKKYENVINGTSSNSSTTRSRRRRAARISGSNSNYDGYEKNFYEKLQSNGYKTVDDFLGLLNKEDVCKAIQDKKEKIDFTKKVVDDKTKNDPGTFYHAEYCEVCPGCGVKRKGGEWKQKYNGDCDGQKHYTITPGATPTNIDVLSFGDKGEDREKKKKEFCKTQNGNSGYASDGGSGYCGGNNMDSSLCEPWKCYKHNDVLKENVQKDNDDEDFDFEDDDIKNAGGLCTLQNKKKVNETNSQNEPEEFQKTFNEFFYFWIGRFLNDSMYWRGNVNNCINNPNRRKCKNECEELCGCFQKWITQKKEEWKKIVHHFNTQEGFGKQGDVDIPGFLGAGMTHDVVLNQVLNLEALFENIKSGYGEVKETEGINKILEQEKKKKKEEEEAPGAASGSGGENKDTSIDKLLKHEGDEAGECLKKRKEKCPEDTTGGLGRILPASTPGLVTIGDDHDSEEEGESEGEENENEGDGQDEDGDEESVSQPELQEEPQIDNKLNVCDIVKKVFEKTEDSALQDACSLKYKDGKERFTQWNCIPTNTNGSSTTSEGAAKVRKARHTTPSEAKSGDKNGAICIPPRRRKLYVGGLTKWVKETQGKGDGSTGEAGTTNPQNVDQSIPNTPASSTSSPTDATQLLRDAFVKSAAIETFFLWDRYKKIKEKEDIERKVAQDDLVRVTSDVGKNLQEVLEKGKIPDEFLRQMFYTLGDYRDICVGVKDEAVRNALEKSVDNKTGGNSIKDISDKIKEILQKQSGTETSVKSPSNSGKTPQETWWDENAKHIWRGMVCALTYKDNDPNTGPRGTDGDKKPIQDENVRAAFFGGDNNPGTKLGTLSIPGSSGTFETEYDYETVSYGGNAGAIATGAGSPDAAQGTKLENFIKRPTFFRWLEEWGESFCRERKRRLKQIKEECRGGNKYTNRYNDGDGFDCTKLSPDKDAFLKDFNGSSCAGHCSFYKKWIKKKRKEFDEQSNVYDKQKEDAKRNKDAENKSDICDKQFLGKLESDYNSIDQFLQRLGPCSKNNNENAEDKIEFDKLDDTFGHKKYCGTCSLNELKCENGKCSGGIKEQCNGETITEEIIKTLKDPMDVGMLVSDKSGTTFPQELNDCKGAGIFKSIRKDVWKCGKLCDYDVCVVDNFKEGTHDKKNVLIRTLFKRWLEYFLIDYTEIQKKLKTCINNENKSPCIKKCVEQWINQKKTEWPTIRNRYLETYADDNENNMKSLVKGFLETLIPRIALTNDKGKFNELKDFLKAYECKCAENLKKENSNEDVIQCLLDKLGEKAEQCKEEHQNNDEKSQTCKDSPPLPDEEEETEENTAGKPSFCEGVVDTKTEEEQTEDGGCDPAPTTPKDPAPTTPKKPSTADDTVDESGPGSADGGHPKPEGNPEQVDQPEKNPGSERPPVQPPERRRTPQVDENPFNHPAVIPSLASSTLAWSVGIGFVALSYWWLKKKTKSSVDLLRVLQIPKSDYEIPTFKSKNRYTPYKSAQYRGKRYIYIEGDSGTDSGYTDHYSDITSSSESEYEEFDINDIYVPHAPKYKTLIEVVLEPSKRDKQSGNIQNDEIPSDIPNTPSDIPSPITDDEWNELKQNFISNMLQNTQPNDVPNDYTSGDIPTNTNNTNRSRHNVDNNTHPTTSHDNVDNNTHATMSHYNVDNNTHPTPSRHNVDNNTHPTPSRHTLDQKPFIMSIHDRNLLNGEEYNYDINMSTNTTDDPKYVSNNVYSGIDLINDALSGDHDIYDEVLKRKENELFGTEHPKNTSNNSVAKNTNSDPVMNQLNLFDKWLDRHRDMCEKWSNKEDILNKLKEEWNKDNNNNSGNKTSNIPSNIPSSDIQTSDIPSGKLSDIHSGKLSDIPNDNNIHSDNKPGDIPSGNKTLNTDVSIQINMNDPKPINQFTNMDTILEDLDKYNEPYYDVQDDIYYDVNDHDALTVDNNNIDVPSKVKIEMSVKNTQMMEEKYPIGDVLDI
ncbi:erythrocyte membrane protein 1, PfEMP1, putative [Plasmodium reichenowi]|uniref:Erythrocyte membrane protein 1, PfEMP1, putative n=2 Tax=Plasmodium reichenowi TaxID=5854 RepID=A0A2P9DBU2_PLARE|nr:erythrocyte membrane protein 1, PfEMP1, putative [Plasmodium reichenowi]